jgi:hypothetical protein
MVWPVSLSWLKGFGRGKQRPAAVVSGRHRPRFEALEDRYLLTTVTTLADSGAGSLRQAITSTAAKGTIDFKAGLTGTITLKSILTLNKNLTITGPGPSVITVSGNDVTGVFIVDGGFTVAISGLTITHGKRISSGAGITNAGNLTLSTCIVSNNTDTGGPGTLPGAGAISNSGTLTIVSSTISNNTALTGISAGAGGLINQGTPAKQAVATLTNCTITGNQGITGGGIYNINGNLALVNCTVSGNSTGSSGKGGGVSLDTGTTVTLRNALVAGNSAPTAPDVSGPVTNADHNLVGDGTGSTGLTNGQNGNQVGTTAQPINPKLGILLNNGGLTPTLALLPGSPAILAGTSTDAPTTDQRGLARPTGGAVSIGAFEFQSASPAQAFFAVGAGNGRVQLRKDTDGSLIAEFSPFGSSFTGPVAVAVGSVIGDGFPDLVVGAAAGNPQVKVYNGLAIVTGGFNANTPDNSLITSFFAYGLNFNIGANVAVGSISNSGYGDIVTGASAGNPQVKVYSGKAIGTGTFNSSNPDASLLAQWFAYGLNFNVGANVAVGDLNKNGFADVVTGATAGNPHVKIYSGKAIANGTFSNSNPDASLVAQFFPYALQFNVGAFVSVGDVDGDGFPDLITGASVGNPDVRVYNGQAFANGTFNSSNADASRLAQFFAYQVSAGIGVAVAAHDFEGTGKADILTGPTTGAPNFRVVKGLSTGIKPPAVNGIDQTFVDGTTPLLVGA